MTGTRACHVANSTTRDVCKRMMTLTPKGVRRSAQVSRPRAPLRSPGPTPNTVATTMKAFPMLAATRPQRTLVRPVTHRPLRCLARAARCLHGTLFAAVAAFVLVGFLATHAVAQQRGPRSADGRVMPTVITDTDLREILALVRPSLVPVRVTEDLGPGFRPREVQGDGVATALRWPEGDVILVTPYAYLSRANRVEVFLNGAWVEARVRYGTPMFDLAMLETDAGIPEDMPALPLPDAWPIDAAIFALAPVDPVQDAIVMPAAFGLRPEGDFRFYHRATVVLRNGYPVVTRDGYILGLTSLPAPDGQGSLTVGFEMIALWREEWPQLSDDAPLGWEPRVTIDRTPLSVGDEAMRPRNAPPRTTP